jgi:hypothetical protein
MSFAQSRARSKAQEKFEKFRKAGKMDQTGLYVNIKINLIHYIYAFIDNGCHCYAIALEQFVKKLNLPRIPIKPKGLEQINTIIENGIKEITYFAVNLNGHKQNRVYYYIIPEQKDNVIIGLFWFREKDIILRSSKGRMKIKLSETIVRFRNRCTPFKVTIIHRVSAEHMIAVIRRTRKTKDQITQIFTASLQNIEKTLSKFNKKLTDPLTKLPEYYKHQLDCFKKEIADQLPPHRPGIDHVIPTQTEEIPWGPLYNISKEELLVLRKTLTKLLNKGFIRISSSSAGAPVLFARKSGEGLRFCMNYRRLNEITQKDRTLLPFITEILQQLSKAT